MKSRTISSPIGYVNTDDTLLQCNAGANAIRINLDSYLNYKDTFTIKKTDSTVNAISIYSQTDEVINGIVAATPTTITAEGNKIILSPVFGGFAIIHNDANDDTGYVNVSGDTMTGNLTAPVFISNVATGTAPLTVTSTTKVDNLNADFFDDMHTSIGATPNTIVARDSAGDFTSTATDSVNTSAVAVSITNGNILINEAEVNVYTHPAALTGGFYVYDKAINLEISGNDIYHGFYEATPLDITAGTNNGWTVNDGVLVDANITSEADNTVLRIVTSASHNLAEDDIVIMTNMNNAGHNGATCVTVINDTTFDCNDIAYVTGAGASSGKVIKPTNLEADAGTSGIHFISFSMSAFSAIANKTYKVEAIKDASALDNIVAENTLNSFKPQSFGASGYATITAGQKIWLQLKNITDSTNMTIKHMNLTVTQIK